VEAVWRDGVVYVNRVQGMRRGGSGEPPTGGGGGGWDVGWGRDGGDGFGWDPCAWSTRRRRASCLWSWRVDEGQQQEGPHEGITGPAGYLVMGCMWAYTSWLG
jgi:hypothetical protein